MGQVNQQFEWVVDILNKNNIPYWIDDGTLLGIVRDNSLIESDRDIDISVWHRDKESLKNIIPIFDSSGYRFITKKYYGNTTSYSFFPGKNPKHDRTVNFKLYRVHKDHAWYPTYRKRQKTFTSRILWETSQLYWKVLFFLMNEKRIPTKPVNIYKIKTYWIPIKYYDDTSLYDKYDVPVPNNLEQYLEFRFGDNWQTPTDDWDFWNDDGGIISDTPSEITDNSLIVD